MSSQPDLPLSPFDDPFEHLCPFVGGPVGSDSDALRHCRCYESREFFDAQDSVAVRLDAMRAPGEK